MFCEQVPCQCNAKPKPERKARAPKKAAEIGTKIHETVEAAGPVKEFEPAPTRKPGPFAGFVHPSVALASGNTTAKVEELAAEQEQKQVEQAGEDDAFKGAMAVLRDARILSREDQRRVELIAPRNLDKDALAVSKDWRARNG